MHDGSRLITRNACGVGGWGGVKFEGLQLYIDKQTHRKAISQVS